MKKTFAGHMMMTVLLSVFLSGQMLGQEPSETPIDPHRETAEFVDEVLVTAQKGQDNLQKVPVSVSVMSGEEVRNAGMRTSSDLVTWVPNLQITSGFSAANPMIFLRGVGLPDYNANASGAVSLYLDEVYLATPAAQVVQLLDIEQIEVMKGPQGTVFGHNTTGGAIHLVTQKPGQGSPSYVRGRYGRFRQQDLDFAYERQLGRTEDAVRFASTTQNRRGYTTNILNGDDENDIEAYSAALQLRSARRENLELRLKLNGAFNRSGSRAYQSRGLFDGADALGYVDDPDPFRAAYNKKSREDIDVLGASASVQWQHPVFTLMSISSYLETLRIDSEDSDASPNQLIEVDWLNESSQISQEIRLTANKGDLDWMFGAYLFSETLEADNLFDVFRELRSPTQGFDPGQGIFLLRQLYDQETDSAAAFGRWSLPVTERLSFHVGLRHTWEDKQIVFDTAFEEPMFSVALIDFQDSLSVSEFSGGGGLSFRAGEDLLLYANLRRGFKSGGFNGGAFFANAEVSAVEPEFVTSFEVGAKSSWLDRRLVLNVAAFHYDYKDLQVFNIVNNGGIPIQFLDNAANAEIEGLELEMRTTPIRGFDLRVAVGLLDARYERYEQQDGSDFSGNRLISAPQWSWTGSAGYWRRLGQVQLGGFVQVSSRDDVFFDSANNPRIGMDDYTLWDARLTAEFGIGRLALALFAKNLTDRLYLAEAFDVSDFGFDQLVIGEPRTYGLEATFRF